VAVGDRAVNKEAGRVAPDKDETGVLFQFGKEKGGRAGKRGTAWSCEEVVGEISVVAWW